MLKNESPIKAHVVILDVARRLAPVSRRRLAPLVS